jgi:glutaredoxin 3
MILYAYPECPFCAMVLHEIEDLGLKIEMRNTRVNAGYSKELRGLTGRTQVPCLVIDGKPLLESADIIDYLRSKNQDNGSGS